MTSANSTSESVAPKKTAILLYGMLREFQVCAPAFLRHVVQPKEAGLFFFGPDQTDSPTVAHKGTHAK